MPKGYDIVILVNDTMLLKSRREKKDYETSILFIEKL